MSKETKDRLVTFSVLGLSVLALIIFAMCIFGEHDSSMIAIGLGCVATANLINVAKNKKNNSDDK